VVLGVALFAETLGRGAIGLALSVPGLVLMATGILALARGGVAPSVVPGVATAIEGAIEAAEAKATQGKATGQPPSGPKEPRPRQVTWKWLSRERPSPTGSRSARPVGGAGQDVTIR
jgi:hypothetical protein